ncbi:MAG: hypothetical protein A2513_01790 [Sulfurimonas sp. RIFOXYD12_FULL_33_39]|uniref:SapC family protein n=1 Tax=unclassified Sulfurimonas TaxID=2623549 RepID=UPI0008BBC1DA|nr:MULTISPECIES: SapC family protein [unclassified Sulfurimonas]OHE04869.1 MAG: hypothetical protein A3G74_02570 [Sulfurimonas sp. RIFCSPLOWO2_12_FULL_34_6]OHE08729.1 MAG: hypothetical protein A2513_01790 [Sulfurimonas sp. RIFOXYD12_FULL_33_39]OHE14014.1 MAG: hypothetical protein A2530_03115 [Sulfurimonas sp. RIFOXYD2_FULL_34_21]DAB28453.1 MAG TPA: hypothetical protein CFH78_02335 [Sulfurimonas sp. UBA10385]
MARKVRVFIENAPQHVILKSIDNITLFKEEQDYMVFLEILKELSLNHDMDIHSYILMPRYFEFLATPKHADALSKYMQSLGRKYVGYFNKKYNRTGTLWEGRYKASLIEDKNYLFEVMKYIEQQVHVDYAYSSVGKNLFGKADSIVTQNELYKKLGYTDEKRLEQYSQFFYSGVNNAKKEFITSSLEKQLVTGSVDFIKNLQQLVGMTLISKERGRPKKEDEEKRKKMYKNLVVLDKEQHKDLKISPIENLFFAKQSAFIPVLANEVALVGAAFPVVFTSGENTSLVSLVSLGGESLAINADGKWITSYVPSYLRKYPFSLASTKENPNQKVILIDAESSLFSKSKGKQLFKKDGEKSETLAHAINFLTLHENQAVVTSNVAKVITDSGILEEREISVGEGDEKKVLVNGFKVVDRDKLNALSDDILADWVRKGIISLIDAHLKSLDNIQALFNIAHQRQS